MKAIPCVLETAYSDIKFHSIRAAKRFAKERNVLFYDITPYSVYKNPITLLANVF